MTTPHPDLELLSALVDDIDEGGTADHVQGCAQCAATLQALRRTARLVGEQPAATGMVEDGADTAVATAMAAVADEQTAPIVPITRRRRLPAWVLPAAAAVLVVAAGIPLAAGLSSSRSTKHSTAAERSGPAAKSAAPAQSSGDTAGGEALAADLGPINDPDHLRSAIATAASAADAPAAATAGGAGTATPAPANATAGSAGSDASPTAGSRSATCTSGSRPPGATTVYIALLIWQGTPAQVVVQTRADGSRVAIVTSRANCSVLLTLPL